MVAVPQKGAGGAGGQRLRLEVDADPPHEQGAGLLRFVPVEAAVRADGGRPTSRGRPPTAFFGGRGARGNGRCSSKGAALRGCGQGPQTDGPEGQTVPRPALYPRQLQTGYAPLKRFCPAHTCSPLARGRGGGVFPSLHSPTALRPKRLNISFDSKPCPVRARKEPGRAAPGRGISPSRKPRSSPVPQRRRRTAPARGPSAVCTLYRPIRTETQQTRPLLVGRVCVNFEPKALAAGTAGPKALADGTAVSLWGGGGSGRRRRRS